MASNPPPPQQAGQTIPLDANIEIDPFEARSDAGDSALGEDSASTSSTSLASSIQNYKYENGRRYHAFREGQYLLPNDEAEADRLDLHHHIFRLMLGGVLYRAPLAPSTRSNMRVLDFGTGTGIWAIDFADEHPHATVLGTDLSPIQPSWVPANCRFYVDDVESEWVFREDERFDFIHGRGMGGSISDWGMLCQGILASLKPDGWVELQEYEAWITSEDDPNMERSPNVKKWQELCDEGSMRFGKRLNIAKDLKGHLIAAGFEDVQDDVYKIPIGPWAKDKKLKELGMYQREHMVACVEAFTLALFTRVLGWSVQETQVLMAGVKNEFRDRNNHLITIFHYVYGRRPA